MPGDPTRGCRRRKRVPGPASAVALPAASAAPQPDGVWGGGEWREDARPLRR